MPNRREFLIGSGLGLAALASKGRANPPVDSTWLVYAPNLDQFWSNLPFAERLKKAGEAGFTRYEFGRWRTKDVDAIAKANEELGLQATLFAGYSGLKGPKWKDGLLEAAGDSSELAPNLGSAKVGVTPPDRDEAVDRADQVEDLVDALKEAVEKLGESEIVLILEPMRAAPGKPKPLVGTAEEAAAVVKATGSGRVKFAFPVDPKAVLGGAVPGQVREFKDQVGYYRLVDFAPPAGEALANYARVLRAIHDVGHPDPIGLGLAPKGDPSAAIEAIRKLDDAARAL